MTPNTLEAYRLFHKGIEAFALAERQGIRIDVDYYEQKIEKLQKRIERLEKKFYNTNFFKHWQHTTKSKVNINSDTQLRRYLYGVKKIEPIYATESGEGSTDEKALKQLQIPEIDDLLRIRKLKKIKSTYLEGFLRESVNGYIHPSFDLHWVRTYRGSSRNPNFQNIPKRDKEAMQICRKGLYPRPGHRLLEIDFSKLEVSIAACYHKDPMMLKYLTSDSSDMHGDMAQQIFKIKKLDKSKPSHNTLRAAAKNGFVFPQFYGDYYGNNALSLACDWGKLPNGRWKGGQGIELENNHLSDHLIKHGIKSIKSFIEFMKEVEKDFWYNRFPTYQEWKEKWWKYYQKNGYIDMLTGFRCKGVMSRNDCINYPVQGAAFHCLLWSFIKLTEIMVEEKWETKLIGQIHDAIVFDAHPDELDYILKVVKKVTTQELPEQWKWIIVPLSVDADIGEIDGSWAEMKNLDF